jgi:drug/metabolite transporter (DMT)-like permease
VLSLVLAVLAAGCNAISSVLQRKANRDEARERPFGVGLLLHLFSRRIWLTGIAAMIASFLLQATALAVGQLSLVEPVLVLELPLALILGAVVMRHRLNRRNWLDSAVMAAGLALLIAALAPSGGHAAHVGTGTALAATCGTFVGVAVLVGCGQFGPQRARAALFGAAAGSGFGLTAALMKLALARLTDRGVVAMLTAWPTYATAVLGIASVALVQAALHAGTLVAAQPGITVADPLVSLLWGTLVIGESTRGGAFLWLAAAGGVMIVVAAIALSRHAVAQAEPPPSEAERAAPARA